ncbi:DUF1360 domain-containing protein [Bacillus sp. JJ722]|uniref:DUF1360 domain-containing protein n=1 Tax=Bacillus sp. JJ722 TaxID=3122973 RepID=UPI002FFD9230
MIDSLLDFILLALASFRLTRLIVYDKITSFLRKPFFEEEDGKNEKGEIETYIVPKKKGIKGFIGQLLNCYWCTGVWIAIFIVCLSYFFSYWSGPVIVVLAVAGLAAILETLVQHYIDE